MPEPSRAPHDVLAGGGDDPGRHPGSRATLVRRLAGGLAAVVAAVLVVTQGGLLSAGDRSRTEAAPGPGPGGRLVALVDGHLSVSDGGDWPDGPDLPDGLGSAADLVPVTMPSGRSHLVGVVRRTLFRVDPATDEPPTTIGRAAGVVGTTGSLGRVVVERPGGAVVEVDAATGRLLRRDPFPAYDPAFGWRPAALMTIGTGRALLVGRRAAGGTALALAAPARPAGVGPDRPALRPIGTVPRLIGVAADVVLAAVRPCPGPECAVVVLTITRDDVFARRVAAPAGWRFRTAGGAAGGSGRSAQGLLALRRVDGSADALARLVAGGASTLLVAGSPGVDLAAGLVDDLDGTVYTVVAGRDGVRRVLAWDPGAPARLRRVGAAPPSGAELVCACG